MTRCTPTLLTLMAFVGFSSAQTNSPALGTYARIKVHGKSLEGNLSGEPADRDVSVYLPPGYQTQNNRRYPVVYLLHGYTNSDIGWFGPDSRGSFANGNTMTAAADRAFTSRGTREFILVMPNAYTMYQGRMFSNSITTGDWKASSRGTWWHTWTATIELFRTGPAVVWQAIRWAGMERCALRRNIHRYFRPFTS
jgi:S-formylglutathione hydrolase